MIQLKTRICEICGKSFTNRRTNGQSLGDSQFLKKRFCSSKCSGFNQKGQKRKPHTKEWKRVMSKRLIREHALGLRKNIFTIAVRKKMSESRIKGFREGRIATWNKGKKLPQFSEERNPQWKGDDVGYHGLHAWVEKTKGKPKKCESCGNTSAKKFEWCSINHLYKRRQDNWIRLCTRCHRNYDYGNIVF